MKTRTESSSKPKSKGDGGTGSSSETYASPREQMIAEAAYFHAERRGFAPGNELSDWLQAEVDVEASHSRGH